MNNRRLGMIWERESRKILKEKFKTEDIFKLINPERIDWIIFYESSGPCVALVESKSTKKNKYYPFENKNKREQIATYFKKRDNIRSSGITCDFYFLIKKGKEKQVFFEKIEELQDIPKSY